MKFERLLIGGGTLVVFLLVWELCADSGAINPLFISSPSRIAQAGAALMADPDFWNDVRVSAREFIFGYIAAIVIGVPLGLLMGTSRRLSYIVAPFVDTLNAVPRVTLLPLLIIWFGIGIWSKVAVVFLGAVIPIVISALAGVKTNEARYLTVARSFSAS
jgi:ABC-type nitrate/sulfonate/bicarbonate transport system permease component